MQLRAARLCLDCEELYEGSSCPVCASERYAFLSKWLPSDERRRWRRPAPRRAHAARQHIQTVKRAIDRWFGHGDPEPPPTVLKTRASDFVPRLDFEEPREEPQKKPAPVTQPLKDDV